MRREFLYKIFSNIPELRTDRLILRRMLVSDHEDMFDYARRADVTRFLTWNPHPSKSYTKEYLEYVATRYSAGEFYDWAVVERVEGRMIGTCGFTRFDCQSNSGEVGYVLNPKYWGREYIPEALREVLRFGFEKLNLNRIEAKYMEGNCASRRVMEKVGMSYEGMMRSSLFIRGEYRNVGICSILRSEYLASPCLSHKKAQTYSCDF